MEPLPVVAILLHAAEARARVAAGVGDDLETRNLSSAQALFETLDSNEVALVVLDAADANGRSAAPTIAALQRNYPTVPILAYCALSGAASAAVLDAARAGVTGLVFRGFDDSVFAMREAIRSARQGSVARRVQEAIAPLLPANAVPFLRYAITRVNAEPSVEDAAKTLGVDRKTLLNWLRRCGVVRPREFINWTRLAIGVGMLEDPKRSAERVALDLGFASGTAFRNMLHRYTDSSCSEIRAAGGLECLLALFRARLSRRAGADIEPEAADRESEAAMPGRRDPSLRSG